MQTTPAVTAAHSRPFTVFFGRVLRRAETRFCARRNGDSSSISRSTRRASSISESRSFRSRSIRSCLFRPCLFRPWRLARADGALGGYNSSCKMVEPDFRAISRVSCRCGIAEPSNYNFISRFEIDKILVLFHSRESEWISPVGPGPSCRGKENSGHSLVLSVLLRTGRGAGTHEVLTVCTHLCI